MTEHSVRYADYRAVVQMAVQIAVAVLLPGVGFLCSQVIEHGSHIAVIEARHKAAISSIDKQQRLRDEALRRELVEIKASLKELQKR